MLRAVTSANVACGFHAGRPADAHRDLSAGGRQRRPRSARRSATATSPGSVAGSSTRRPRSWRPTSSTRSARWTGSAARSAPARGLRQAARRALPAVVGHEAQARAVVDAVRLRVRRVALRPRRSGVGAAAAADAAGLAGRGGLEDRGYLPDGGLVPRSTSARPRPRPAGCVASSAWRRAGGGGRRRLRRSLPS